MAWILLSGGGKGGSGGRIRYLSDIFFRNIKCAHFSSFRSIHETLDRIIFAGLSVSCLVYILNNWTLPTRPSDHVVAVDMVVTFQGLHCSIKKFAVKAA